MDTQELRRLVNFEQGLVKPQIFSDPEIYQLEQKRLFARSWILLAHETQIPKPGDFFTTWMGGDPVLVVRKRDRTVGAYLNACRHRGMKVCRADAGNAKAFTCTYHGWAYNTDGTLANVPNLDDGYYNELDTTQWGLVPVTQLDTYKGLIFGNWDPTAPALLDYLGESTFYLDCLIDRREGGVEVLPGIHKWTFRGNWKLAAEQFAGDNYHAPISHASAFRAISPPEALANGSQSDPASGRQYSSRWGHGSGFRVDPSGSLVDVFGSPLLAEYFRSTLPEAQARLGRARAIGPIDAHNNIFPTMSFLNRPVNTLRVWHPKGPNSFETWAYTLVDVAAPDEVKEEQRLLTLRTFSAGGLFEQDDSENWSQIGEILSYGGTMVNQTPLNYQMGLGHERTDDPDYPGFVGAHPLGDNPQRRFYQRWLDFMTSETWPIPEGVRGAELSVNR